VSDIGIPERACVVKGRFGRVFALLTVGEWSWDALNPEPVSEARGRIGLSVLVLVGSWVVGHDGSGSGPLSGREANRVRLPGHPFATHHKWVVGMEQYGHSRAGLNHIHRPAPSGGVSRSCREFAAGPCPNLTPPPPCHRWCGGSGSHGHATRRTPG
jgi:hypothetical protein